MATADQIELMEVARTDGDVAAALVPFLEHDGREPRAHGREHAAQAVPLSAPRPCRAPAWSGASPSTPACASSPSGRHRRERRRASASSSAREGEGRRSRTSTTCKVPALEPSTCYNRSRRAAGRTVRTATPATVRLRTWASSRSPNVPSRSCPGRATTSRTHSGVRAHRQRTMCTPRSTSRSSSASPATPSSAKKRSPRTSRTSAKRPSRTSTTRASCASAPR
jgi:hypothetical protein